MANKRSNRLCPECSNLDIHNFFTISEPLSECSDPAQRWGLVAARDFTDIQKNIHCLLCQLVRRALTHQKASRVPTAKDRVYYYRILYGEYERQETSLDGLFWRVHRTNRLLVTTFAARLRNVDIEFARFLENFAPDSPGSGDPEGYIMLLDDSKIDSSFLHGRAVDRQFDFNLAKRWMGICTDSHGDACFPDPLGEKEQRPLRVINISERRVQDTPGVFSYAALSYCWGAASQLSLSAATKERLTTIDGLADNQEDIPLTIRDAMVLCGKLSIPYLWVDALCIMQDDCIELQGQMDVVPSIYRGACLTIAAAFGPNAWAGLPGVRAHSRPAQQKAHLDNFSLALARPCFYSLVEPTFWNSRAWIFQETFLSKRLLIFTKYQVLFRCGSASWREDTEHEPPRSLGTIRKVITPVSDELRWKDVHTNSPDFFNSYAYLVEDYSKRSITKESDILRAFQSIAQVSGRVLNTPFFYGLPIRLFQLAILFEAYDAIPREFNFPSWSWCFWKSTWGVEYDSERLMETYTIFGPFYHLVKCSGSAWKLSPINCQSGTHRFASHPTVIPTGLKDIELGYLLVFEAPKAHVHLDLMGDSNDCYTVRIPHIHNDKSPHAGKYIGSCYMNPEFRQRLSGDLFECVNLAIQHSSLGETDTLNVWLMLIDTDSRGASRRIGLFQAQLADWLEASPRLEVVFLL